MKKALSYGLSALCVLCLCITLVNAEDKNIYRPKEHSIEELYQNIYLALLIPYIDKAVDAYYKPYFKHSPGVASYMIDVLDVDNPVGGTYIIKVQVMPYFGPHLTVGVDHITLQLVGASVQIENFEHIKSHELPPHYQHEIINQWPPAETTSLLH